MVLNKTALSSIVLALFLGACSSGEDFGLGSGSNDDGGSTAGTETGTETGDDGDDGSTTSVIALGTGSGTTFTSGAVSTGVADGAVLTYGSSTIISVNVVDTGNSNALETTSNTVSFTSSCVAAGLATIDASAVTINGTASVTYNAGSCTGADTVTATISGSSASGTFSITDLNLGTGSGGTFAAGAMTDTISGGGDLSFGGDTAISVNVVDASDNSLFTSNPVSVAFTSSCVQSGLATIDSPVITSSGVATSSYTATACEGTDTITATLADGTTATRTITIAEQTLGSLEFVSASPTTIALQGSGSSANPEVSDITFLLRDNTGEPIQGQTVTYELSTTVGGITLSSDSSVTASDGTTSISLNAGGVVISVSVTATVTDDDDNTIVTTSSPIAIVGGIPDQNSFSISVDVFNPRGFDVDGEESTISIRAADRYNNPIPDGTQISFVTDGGSIVGSCAISEGACSTTWTSQNPRPFDAGSGQFGVVNILARTTGEESFTDTNSNGQYDIGEPILEALDEAFLDADSSGTYDLGEFFSDFNEDGSFTTKPDPTLFLGTNCSDAALAAGHCANLVDVRASAELCMSTDAVIITDDQGAVLDISDEGTVINVTITDGNNLTPAAGTTINVASENVEIVSGGTVVVPNACVVGGFTSTVTLNGAFEDNGVSTGEASGLIKFEVTRADGILVEYPITILR